MKRFIGSIILMMGTSAAFASRVGASDQDITDMQLWNDIALWRNFPLAIIILVFVILTISSPRDLENKSGRMARKALWHDIEDAVRQGKISDHAAVRLKSKLTRGYHIHVVRADLESALAGEFLKEVKINSLM